MFGISPLQCAAIHIATVQPLFSYNSGSWYHYYGGMIPLLANKIATVEPV